MNCSSDLKHFENSRPSALNFKSFSRSVEQFFLTVGRKYLVTKYHWHLRKIDVLFNFTKRGIEYDQVADNDDNAQRRK